MSLLLFLVALMFFALSVGAYTRGAKFSAAAMCVSALATLAASYIAGA